MSRTARLSRERASSFKAYARLKDPDAVSLVVPGSPNMRTGNLAAAALGKLLRSDRAARLYQPAWPCSTMRSSAVGREFRRRAARQFRERLVGLGKLGDFRGLRSPNQRGQDQDGTQQSPRNPHTSKVYDGRKGNGVQAGATHQRAIDLFFGHQARDVVGLHAAAVQDAARFRRLGAKLTRGCSSG